MLIRECTNIEELLPICKLWLKELHADDYGLDVDVNVIFNDLLSWMEGEGVVLVAEDDNTIIGMIAVVALPSYLGSQKIAIEKYWYAQKGGYTAGPKLYVDAINWAREHGCSHFIASGSKLASNKHDSICRFLEHTGAKPFETSYIYKLGDD